MGCIHSSKNAANQLMLQANNSSLPQPESPSPMKTPVSPIPSLKGDELKDEERDTFILNEENGKHKLQQDKDKFEDDDEDTREQEPSIKINDILHLNSQQHSNLTAPVKRASISATSKFGDFFVEHTHRKQSSSWRIISDIYSEAYNQVIFQQYDPNEKTEEKGLIRFLHDNYIGQGEIFQSPFGIRQIMYCDWTASGKNLKCIEQYISNEIQPFYANTHTSSSITGIQTSHFRLEARQIVLKSVGGNFDKDYILFCGSGTTGAMYKLSRIIMQNPNFNLKSSVVFIGIYEHNSNMLIWKEYGFKVVIIPENREKGGIDQNKLIEQLKLHDQYTLKIGSFSGASNISGIIEHHDEITKILHEYNALSFWDFATGAPYLSINLSNDENDIYSKDAVCLSPHKMLGGPQTPGVLGIKKKLFDHLKIPIIPGGGTIFFSYGPLEDQHEYLENIEEREEGGTQDIIGSIRCGLTFMIKNLISVPMITKVERGFIKNFFKIFKHIHNIHIIGNTNCDRLPIIAFNISYTNKKNQKFYLHQNFIAALFNDLFGIQGRSGCSCAGMYGLQELNLKDVVPQYIEAIHKENELIRPGYFRINFHYTLSMNEYQYIINCILFMCKHAYKFLPLYEIKVNTGEFIHYKIANYVHLKTLTDIKFMNGDLHYPSNHQFNNKLYKQQLKLANDVLAGLEEEVKKKANDYGLSGLDQLEENKDIKFYWLPCEIYDDVIHDLQHNLKKDLEELQEMNEKAEN